MVDRRRPEYERIAAVLRARRTKAGLTQSDLAERLGRRQEWVSRNEVSERRLDVVELGMFADALKTSIDEILDEAGIRHRKRKPKEGDPGEPGEADAR